MTAQRLRVGTDIESIDAVAAAIRTFGRRYVERIYTVHEIESAGGCTPLAAPGLAARFAAKEAVMKLLRLAAATDWREIEVRRDEGGWCRIELAGRAASTASQLGLHSFDLSLSHGAGVGTATVIALAEDRHNKQ